MHCKKIRNLCKYSADLAGLHVTRIFTKMMIHELPNIMHAEDDIRNGFNVRGFITCFLHYIGQQAI